MLFFFSLFALFVLFVFNSMTDALCIKKEIPVERHHKIFRTINVLITILLTSTYIKILFT